MYTKEGLRLVGIVNFCFTIVLCGYYLTQIGLYWSGERSKIQNNSFISPPQSYYSEQPLLNDNNMVITMAKGNQEDKPDGLLDENQRLTDLLMPFTKGQVNRLQESFKSWTRYPPCPILKDDEGSWEAGEFKASENLQDFYQRNPNVGRNVSLTLVISGTEDDGIRKQLLNSFHALPKNVTQCFSNVKVHFAGLVGEEDSYMLGSRNMFELFLNNTFGLINPYYVFYMEPDVRPLRKYWLAALDATSRWPTCPFWIKGSLYRGTNRAVLNQKHYALHINGNAIYNLADKAFRDFYFDQVKPFIKDHPRRDGYDSDLYLHLLDENNYERNAMIAHKFPYTDLIQNMWHESFSISKVLKRTPQLYLSHGGTPHEED